MKPYLSRALVGVLLSVPALSLQAAPAYDPGQLQGQISQSLPQGGQMEFLLREAARLQACMKDLDEASLADLRKKGEAAAAEVRQLCDTGQRDQAQALAMDSARTLADLPSARKLLQCSGALSELLDALPLLGATAVKGMNVCDVKLPGADGVP